MSLPSITHEITVGLGGETIYTRDFVYQHDNASDFFEVTIEGVADLLIFGEGITVTYELMRDGQKILALDEYPCELLLTGGAITKVLCALPSEIRKHYGYWSGQIHLYLGESRRSTDIFVFSSLPGMRPDYKTPGKPSGAETYFDAFGLALDASPTVAIAKRGEHSNGIGLTASESDGDPVPAIQGEVANDIELSQQLDPINRIIVLAELNEKIGLESDAMGWLSDAMKGEYVDGIEAGNEISTMIAHAERAEINTGADTDGLADGRVSHGYFTAYTDENAEALSAEGATSDVVSAELSGKYAISLEAEATVVTPTRYYIEQGSYVTQTDISSVEAVEIDVPIFYRADTQIGEMTYADKLKVQYNAILRNWLLFADSSILGNYYNNQWALLTYEGEYPHFDVIARTEVTAAQKAVFDRYFQLHT